MHLLVGYGCGGNNDEHCLCTKFLHMLLASHCEASAAQDAVPCLEKRALGPLEKLMEICGSLNLEAAPLRGRDPALLVR